MSEASARFRPLFYPQSIAVIGATSTYGKWGYIYTRNIREGFKGRIYPVHPALPEILGLPAYKSMMDIPGPVDLALILLQPDKVYAAVQECVEKKVRAIVVITAGFGEMGEQGQRLQEAFAEPARRAGIPLIGPNCMGLINARAGLSAQLFYLKPKPGRISIVSQSGNLGGNIIRQGISDGIGFSKFLSSGNEAVTTCEEILEYYAEDEDTDVVLAYVEGVKHGPRFLRAAKTVTRKKPLVMLKGGYTAAGSAACTSHTGAMAGSDEIFNAVCRQAGMLRVYNVPDMYMMGATLAAHPLPAGNRVGIVTEGGGLGVIAADACVAMGLEVPALPREMIEELNKIMPDRWSHGNPVDTAAGPGKMKSVEMLARSDVVDAIIQVGVTFSGSTYQALNEKPAEQWTETDKKRFERVEQRLAQEMDEARFLVRLSHETGKPILSADQAVSVARIKGNPTLEYLSSEGIIVYPDPYHAVRAMSYLVQYAAYRRKG